MRSLTLLQGLKNSSFTSTVAAPAERCGLSRTRGVLYVVATMSSIDLSACHDAAFPVLLTPKIVNLFTKISDQRERAKVNRAVARIGSSALPPCGFPVNRYSRFIIILR